MTEGSLLSDYNFSSGSGTNYSKSFVPTVVSGVPEPGSMLLLMREVAGVLRSFLAMLSIE
jgi:hypothetical protein